MDGWIKIHRKIKQSSFFKRSNVIHVFVYLLISANRTVNKFYWNNKEIEIHPGQLITGRNTIVKETGVTPQRVKTALTILKSTNTITIKSTNKFSIITILNWEDYQNKTTSKKTNKLTNNQPTTNQQLTTIQERENVKKVENNIYIGEIGNFLKDWNQIFGTRYHSTDPLLKNFTYWRSQYSYEDLKKAAARIKLDDFWKNKMTPEIFLRRKNPRGEEVDHIGKMLNIKGALPVHIDHI